MSEGRDLKQNNGGGDHIIVLFRPSVVAWIGNTIQYLITIEHAFQRIVSDGRSKAVSRTPIIDVSRLSTANTRDFFPRVVLSIYFANLVYLFAGFAGFAGLRRTFTHARGFDFGGRK